MAFLRIITLSLLLFIISCSEDSARPETRADLLAGSSSFGKAWQITGIEVSLGQLIVSECIADNIIRYYPDGTYEVTEVEKCDPSDPAALTGSWTLSRDETVLSINLPDSTLSWDIESLTNSIHEISASFEEGRRTYTLSSSN